MSELNTWDNTNECVWFTIMLIYYILNKNKICLFETVENKYQPEKTRIYKHYVDNIFVWLPVSDWHHMYTWNQRA